MKKPAIFLTLIITSISFAQITLEHVYPENKTTRTVLENSGEKYYVYIQATATVNFYNTDHSLWKSIHLPISNGTNVTLAHVSETKINSDANLEIAFSYNSGCKVVSENGNTLFTTPSSGTINVSDIDGLSNKMLISTSASGPTTIYSLPDFTMEHIYSLSIPQRIKLELSGEKYYEVDKINQIAKFYNADHSLWKSVNLLAPETPFPYTILGISVVSEQRFNDDALLEFGYNYNVQTGSGGFNHGRIINENNVTIPFMQPGPAAFIEASSFEFSDIDGLDSKLVGYSSQYTVIIEMPSLFVAHYYGYFPPGPPVFINFDSRIVRTSLEISGEKYFFKDFTNSKLKIYNNDHTIWKTIDLDIPASSILTSIGSFSETKIDADALFEFSYSYTAGSKIINENGTVLLDVPNASSLYLSELSGGSNKIIADVLSSGIASGRVYNIEPNLAIIDNQTASFSVYPNPVNSILYINSLQNVVECSIYDCKGILMRHIMADDIARIEVSELSDGLYFVHTIASDHTKTITKIIISN